jgi:hypothetical protein
VLPFVTVTVVITVVVEEFAVWACDTDEMRMSPVKKTVMIMAKMRSEPVPVPIFLTAPFHRPKL